MAACRLLYMHLYYCIPIYTVSHPKRLESSSVLLLKPQILQTYQTAEDNKVHEINCLKTNIKPFGSTASWQCCHVQKNPLKVINVIITFMFITNYIEILAVINFKHQSTLHTPSLYTNCYIIYASSQCITICQSQEIQLRICISTSNSTNDDQFLSSM